MATIPTNAAAVTQTSAMRSHGEIDDQLLQSDAQNSTGIAAPAKTTPAAPRRTPNAISHPWATAAVAMSNASSQSAELARWWVVKPDSSLDLSAQAPLRLQSFETRDLGPAYRMTRRRRATCHELSPSAGAWTLLVPSAPFQLTVICASETPARV
ncbi:hypothetical protein emb_1d0567 [Coriobacteriaceae bacterium EMTCatB1]|nr:hypothetical protein emb_1d0567 [Coriobacteriaceae bacterium EMTCatB1]